MNKENVSYEKGWPGDNVFLVDHLPEHALPERIRHDPQPPGDDSCASLDKDSVRWQNSAFLVCIRREVLHKMAPNLVDSS